MKYIIYALENNKIVHTFRANSVLELFEISGTIEAAGLVYLYEEV
jgi:hypothetical protein